MVRSKQRIVTIYSVRCVRTGFILSACDLLSWQISFRVKIWRVLLCVEAVCHRTHGFMRMWRNLSHERSEINDPSQTWLDQLASHQAVVTYHAVLVTTTQEI